MRKEFLFIFLALLVSSTSHSQTKATKIGYIDMEFILQNVSNYTEAQNQLEQKAQKWKQEIETKKIEINKLKEALKAEKALLTKGLIEERTAEITFLENETLEYQQKRFGPDGDLMRQKADLTKPIQDQVFTAVQDIAETKKYDFIFDKTSDLTMLFAAKRFDISEQIIRVLNRSEKREQLTKKQLKEEEDKEAKEDELNENPTLLDRQKALDAKKAARDKVIADRVLLQEERKKAAEEKKLQIIADRDAKKNGLTASTSKTTVSPNAENTAAKEATKIAAAEAKQKIADDRAAAIEARKQAVEDNKKALEEKRKQIIAEREAKKTATVSPANLGSTNTSNTNTEKEALKKAAAEEKQKQIDLRAKNLEDRKKAIEEAKKAQEEKRKQALDAKKTGTVSESTTKGDTKTKETVTTAVKDTIKTAAEVAKQKQLDARAKALEDRKRAVEDRKKELEEKRKKILEDREAAKKANEEKLKTTK